ncbi:DUF927 domain-containing protein [Plastoroseomonas arctica]|uniref:DUF927 domain-containing protein n=1 Tax=Plastoroseomonas arctica TaxID=1509237 RepID=A0AAF1JU30_9PROT|nr:DUF927 domain-containing protein [Plastoroseomonas arctica]MBR0653650.1 DUF927 domain-containing protein [Plastoroseomonas arctica]
MVDGIDMRDAEDGPRADAAPEIHAAAVTWPRGFTMKASGLHWQGPAEDAPVLWLTSPFAVEGETRTGAGMEWGFLLSWQDSDKRPHTFAVPRRLLLGEAREFEGELLSRGMRIASSPPLRQRFRDALMNLRTTQRITSVSRMGWHHSAGGAVYIAGDGASFGPSAERIVLQGASPDAAAAVAPSGTLAEWQEHVAAMAVGNDLAALFLAAAFAGPILDIAGEPSGGLHAFGASQKGKTTILRLAASVWGKPEAGAALRTWRSTSNGIEGVAAACNDALLSLDELGQCDAREAGEIAYLFANGAGKSRAARDGSARAARSWRLMLLSTGEMDLAAKLAEGGKRAMAGQLVRLLNIPLPEAGPMGQALHGRETSGALLIAANEAARRFHGTAAPAFLERLAAMRAEDAAGLAAIINAARDAWVASNLPADAEGQVSAAARRFGIIAAAGELAASFGILPWPAGEASRAAAAGFRLWVRHRGGAGAHEDAEAVDHVRRFLVAHGTARFAPLLREGEPVRLIEGGDRILGGRVGWRWVPADGQAQTGRQQEYLAETSVFRAEICAGRDHRTVLAALRRAGFLRHDDGRLDTKAAAITGVGRPRVYAIQGAIIGGLEGEA